MAPDMQTLTIILQHLAYVKEGLKKVSNELDHRALVHDLSKFKDDEFMGYIAVKQACSNTEYGSPEHKEVMRSIKDVADPAMANHFSRNSHHPEYHKNIEDMSFLDIIEMVCDWYAAAKTYNNGNLQNSVKIGKEKFNFTDNQLWLIDQVVELLEK